MEALTDFLFHIGRPAKTANYFGISQMGTMQF